MAYYIYIYITSLLPFLYPPFIFFYPLQTTLPGTLHCNHCLIYHHWCFRRQIRSSYFSYYLVSSAFATADYFLLQMPFFLTSSALLHLLLGFTILFLLYFAVSSFSISFTVFKCLVFYKATMWEILLLTTLTLRKDSTTSSNISIFIKPKSLQVCFFYPPKQCFPKNGLWPFTSSWI